MNQNLKTTSSNMLLTNKYVAVAMEKNSTVTPTQVICAAYKMAKEDKHPLFLAWKETTKLECILPASKLEHFITDFHHLKLAYAMLEAPVLNILPIKSHNILSQISMHARCFESVIGHEKAKTKVKENMNYINMKSVVPVGITSSLKMVEQCDFVGTVAHYHDPVPCTVFKPIAKYRAAFKGKSKITYKGIIDYEKIDQKITSTISHWNYLWWWPKIIYIGLFTVSAFSSA